MSLRLASYNVHGFVGTDGNRDVQRIADAIVLMDAHGVGLQEVPFERGAAGELVPSASRSHGSSPPPELCYGSR